MNAYEDHLLDADSFEPIRRSRRLTYARRKSPTSTAAGIHRRRRRHWRPVSKSASALHAASAN